jgi:RNA polymerase sigma-54 factor
MKLGQQLKIKQNQSLIMAPQLQQAIKLLQLSNIELADFIDKAHLYLHS